jgi:hypothetical protein
MKWDGRWRFEVGEDCFLHSGGHGRVLVFAVTPDRMLAFGKAKFTRTSHGSNPGRGSARWRGGAAADEAIAPSTVVGTGSHDRLRPRSEGAP